MSFAVIAIGVSVGTTAYGAYRQNKAAKSAAQVDTATADYNAKLDESMAAQLDLDTQQNIRTERADDAAYLSRQAASYASAGVLSNTGSALDAQIMNAGRLEQRIQQQWVDSQQQQQKYYSAAAVGRLEGDAKATSDRALGTLALVNGGSKILSTLYGGYQSGAISFGSKGDPTAGNIGTD